jgi:hypothetical protein
MASQTPHRLDRSKLDADQASLESVSTLGDYAPVKSDLSIEALRALEAAMIEARLADGRARYEAEVARDRAITTSWAFHEAMKALKAQVLALYGEESLALHAVGLKRRSEHKRPTRQKKVAA